jgi:phosphoribosyl-dephospho-CoA transferase
MELAPHDLLWIRDRSSLVSCSPLPSWVDEALDQAPLVVVRRAPLVDDMVPVGVRGPTRGQRFATYVLVDDIVERITPEQLVAEKKWRTCPRTRQIGALNVLESVDELLTTRGFRWGPTGSVGFELASGVPTATPASDLDLVILVPNRLSIKVARQFAEAFTRLPVRVDGQLETPGGAVLLTEYARAKPPVLLRTREGPRLVVDPWAETGGI